MYVEGISSSARLRAACNLLEIINQMMNIMSAKPATPPTTPPAMAPVFVLLSVFEDAFVVDCAVAEDITDEDRLLSAVEDASDVTVADVVADVATPS